MPPEQLTLAFDTSVAHCAAALLLGDRVLAERVEPMAKGQAERLFGLLQELLQEAGIGWKDLSRIGVGIGPGNFTGIRISVASARGLALSLGVPAIGISTFDALAHGLPRPVIACVNGRSGGFYCQLFAQNGGRDPVTVQADAVPAEFLDTEHSIVGHDVGILPDLLGAKEVRPLFPLAVAIGRLAGLADGDTTPAPAPLYMRAPDAAPPKEVAPEILF